MNSIFNRLLSLFETAGFSTEAGSISRAEAYALATGCAEVREFIGRAKSLVFPDGGSINAYAFMLGFYFEEGDGETLADIITARLSHDFGGCLENAELERETAVLGGGSFSVSQNLCTAQNITAKALNNLGGIIAGAVPLTFETKLTGSGLTFNQWERVGKTFKALDRLMLPFSCIDTLSAEMLDL